jgi:hypothetical protein
MVYWLALGLVLVGLVLLGLAVRPVLVALPKLRRALLALRGRQADAQALQDNVARLQERLAGMQDHVAGVQSGVQERREKIKRPAVGR